MYGQLDMVLMITNKVTLKSQNVQNMDMELYNIQSTKSLGWYYTENRINRWDWKYIDAHKHTQAHTTIIIVCVIL